MVLENISMSKAKLLENKKPFAIPADEENCDAHSHMFGDDLVFDHTSTGGTVSANIFDSGVALNQISTTSKKLADFIVTHFHVRMSVYKEFLKLDFGYEKLYGITDKE